MAQRSHRSSGKKSKVKASPRKSASKKASSRRKAQARSKTEPGNDLELQSLLEQIRQEIWPVERKVLFKPERLRYVRKLVKPEGCVFCHAVETGPSPESLLLYKGKSAIVILNKYPYNNGHLLILPRRHCGEFLEVTEDEHREMNQCLQAAIRALEESYRPSGFNVGLNLGSAAGAGIPEHLHYHVVPRWSGDTNFFPLIADTKVVVETLEQTYERLLPYFEALRI